MMGPGFVLDDKKSNEELAKYVNSLFAKLKEEKGGPGSGYYGHPGGHLEGGKLQRGGSHSLSSAGFTAAEEEAFDWPQNHDLFNRYQATDFAGDGHGPDILKDKVVTILSKRTKIPYETVNELIGNWAQTSNDDSPLAYEIQSDAAKLKGMKLSKWQKEQFEPVMEAMETTREWSKADLELTRLVNEAEDSNKHDAWQAVENQTELLDNLNRHYQRIQMDHANHFGPGSIEQFNYAVERYDKNAAHANTLVESTYSWTQDWLNSVGYPKDAMITLYRGIKSGGKKWVKGRARYKGNAIEAWSLTPTSASAFGDTILAVRVPASRVFSTPHTGFGCLREYEMVIFAGDMDVLVVKAPGKS